MSEHASASRGPARFPWPQLMCLIVGLALILFGMIGFWPTAFEDMTQGDAGRTLLGVQVSPLRNIIHLALGAVGLMCATRLSTARAYGWLLVAVGLVMAGLGVAGVLQPGIDVLSMNVPAIIVAVIIAVLGLVVAVGPDRSAVGSGDRGQARNRTDEAAQRPDQA